jgi:hypothetical protein
MNNDIIFGLSRHLLTTAGGALVTKGLLTAPALDTGVGAAITLVGIVWSIFSKKKNKPTAE